MNSQLFFLLNLVFGAGFLIWFLSSRKGGAQKPTQLRLKRTENGPRPEAPVKRADEKSSPAKPAAAERGASRTAEPPHSARQEKTLNVFFLYNGHDWDAYEVLGLPAGASMTLVTQRYQEVLRSADKGQTEFFEAAYQAILKKT